MKLFLRDRITKGNFTLPKVNAYQNAGAMRCCDLVRSLLWLLKFTYYLNCCSFWSENIAVEKLLFSQFLECDNIVLLNNGNITKNFIFRQIPIIK